MATLPRLVLLTLVLRAIAATWIVLTMLSAALSITLRGETRALRSFAHGAVCRRSSTQRAVCRRSTTLRAVAGIPTARCLGGIALERPFAAAFRQVVLVFERQHGLIGNAGRAFVDEVLLLADFAVLASVTTGRAPVCFTLTGFALPLPTRVRSSELSGSTRGTLGTLAAPAATTTASASATPAVGRPPVDALVAIPAARLARRC
jgi:hypothetical protein